MTTPTAPAMSAPAVPAPPLACKPLAIASVASPPGRETPGPSTPGSVTSKEWVIPPRPKPGRKPAMDTPPTKRKAQNRAAQRAFRERRAARVGELEDQMKQIEDENEAYMTELREQVDSLTREVEQSKRQMAWWRDRCHALEKERDIANDGSQRSSRSSNNSGSNGSIMSSDRQQMPSPRRPSMQTSSRANLQEEAQTNDTINSDDDELEKDGVSLGCNRCSLVHCQCVEDAFGAPPIISPSHSENSNVSRKQTEPQVKSEPEEMEIDFTSRFVGSQPQASSAVSSPAVDPCGFCQDGTPCICAEVAAQEEQHNNQQRRQQQRYLKRPRRNSGESSNRLAPLQNMSQFTPPPSESDVSLPPISHATNLCANGPGTCDQCQADPRSTLFCKSLAASRQPSASSGCCGGSKSGSGGCCQSSGSTKRATARSTTASDGVQPLSLSCADAFTTLSRHPKFTRASDELETWIPKLHTLPEPNGADLHSRPTMEVEAASVMGVLRYFDRRFADK